MMKQVYDVCVFGGGPRGPPSPPDLVIWASPLSCWTGRLKGKGGGAGDPSPGLFETRSMHFGLWKEFRAAGHVAGHAQQTAWGGGPWIQDSIFHVHGDRWHVDRSRFDADLREAVRKRGIVIRDYRSLDDLQREDREVAHYFRQGHRNLPQGIS